MKKKTVLLISLAGSLPCAIVCMLYTVIPGALGNYVWCIFVGFCTTYLYGATVKDTPKVISSYAVGVIWALAFNYFFIWLLQLGVGSALAMFLDVFVITVVLMFVHIGFLQNTWVNKVPMLFPPVFLIFQCGGDMSVYPYMLISLVVGALTAIITDPFCDFITGLGKTPQENE